MKALKLNRNFLLWLLPLFTINTLSGQNIDSIQLQFATKPASKFSAKQKFPGYFILPSILMAAGSIDPGKGGPLNINTYSQHTTQDHWKFGMANIDNYLQFAPASAVYALDAFSVKPQHNFWQRSSIFVAGNILATLSVYALKSLTHVQRPDKTDFHSFPSGHAATAFLGADFFYQEFRHKKRWWIYAGYVVATATGVYRILNDKHWITDVVAGAGFGILSNRVSYLLADKRKNRKVKAKII